MASTRSRNRENSVTRSKKSTSPPQAGNRIEKRGSKSSDEGRKGVKNKVPKHPVRARPTAIDHEPCDAEASTVLEDNLQAASPAAPISEAHSGTQTARPSSTSYNRTYRNIGEAEAQNRTSAYNKYHRDNFIPGTIIRSRHYNEDSDAGTTYSDNLDGQYQLTKDGKVLPEKVFAKERFMMVVKVFGGHFIALPCFTFNDVGVNKKRRSDRHEYIHIGSRESPELIGIEPIHGLYPSLGVQILHKGVLEMRPSTFVHVTAPISIRFTRRVVLAGKLWPESQSRLAELYSQLQSVPYQASGQPTGPLHYDPSYLTLGTQYGEPDALVQYAGTNPLGQSQGPAMPTSGSAGTHGWIRTRDQSVSAQDQGQHVYQESQQHAYQHQPPYGQPPSYQLQTSYPPQTGYPPQPSYLQGYGAPQRVVRTETQYFQLPPPGHNPIPIVPPPSAAQPSPWSTQAQPAYSEVNRDEQMSNYEEED